MTIQELLNNLDELLEAGIPPNKDQAMLAIALRNAYPSLRAEIKRLQEEVEKLKNPLPTQQEEREIYKKIYHNSCNTGCSIPCPNKV